MRRIVSAMTILCMLVAVNINGFIASAQQPDKNKDNVALPRRDSRENLPEIIKRAKSPEARAAWEGLTPEQREQVKARVEAAFGQAKAKAEQEKEKRAQKAERKAWKDIIKDKKKDTDIETAAAFTDNDGAQQLIKGKERKAETSLDAPESTVSMRGRSANNAGQLAKTAALKSGSSWSSASGISGGQATLRKASFAKSFAPAMAQSGDADLDGLPEDFENALADAFTPIYHISAYEPDNFATFRNSVPQDVEQLLGPNPFSYFRVQPLGFDYNYYGQLCSVIRIDYLTLWDHDTGLVTGGNCSAFPGLTSLEGIQAHRLDNERSAALVAAPVTSFTFNLNPSAYSAYSYFTSAHENTPTDKSAYIDFPTNPIPAGWHLHLALSLSKHATYTFNPDYLPILPDYIIYAAYAGVEYYCYTQLFNDTFGIGDALCLASLYYAYGVFYECAVERFFDQGGRFASPRVNVGEPNNPINGAGFIQDMSNESKLYQKLTNPVF